MSSRSKDKEVKPKPRYRSDLKPGDINPYIPKYISEKPWYQETTTSASASEFKKQKLDQTQDPDDDGDGDGDGDGDSAAAAAAATDDSNQQQRQPKEDYLSHQRKNKDVIVDYSVPTSGSGINDEFVIQNDVYIKKIDDDDNDNNDDNDKANDTKFNPNRNNDKNIYDIKRDRWYGYNNKEWDKIFENWENIKQKSKKIKRKSMNKDNEDESVSSDDTDYELELIELDLQRKDIKVNSKQNALEKMIRDREDIPSYIYNITSDPNNKIRIDYDPKSRLTKNLQKGFLNDRNQFVKKLSGDGKDLVDLQKFAWEIDQNDLKKKQKQLLVNKLSTTSTNDIVNNHNNDDNIIETNLDFSLEASPTLMMLKAKEKQEEDRRVQLLKKKALLDKYGSSSPSINPTGHD